MGYEKDYLGKPLEKDDQKKHLLKSISVIFPTPDYSSVMPDETSKPKQLSYEEIVITSPKHDQVFWNVEGNTIPVTTRIEPGLQQGHILVIKLDGKPISGSTLTDLYRGSYVLTAEVHDSEGESLIDSTPVTIHIKRHVLKKKPGQKEPANK